MYNTGTKTGTYTVIDIRKTFEGFEADLRMIARRTDKWSMTYVEQLLHDVLQLAESKYLASVDIVLLNSSDTVLRAVRYKVNEEGKAVSSERPGSNDWSNIANTRLSMVLHYNQSWGNLGAAGQATFMSNNLYIPWSASSIDTRYSHLTKQGGQLYGSNGYELKKENFK
jgi:hypothetical protein